jgi:hypothetical protein
LIFNIAFAQQTEIDGKLKVKGEVDVSGNRISNLGAPTATTDAVNTEFLQSALSDIGPYEFKTVLLTFGSQMVGGTQPENRFYLELESWTSWKTDNFDTYISDLSSAGWELFHINSPHKDGSSNMIAIYTFRKKVN